MEPTDLSSPTLRLSRGQTQHRWLAAGVRLSVMDGVAYLSGEGPASGRYLHAGQSHEVTVAGRYRLWTHSDALMTVAPRVSLGHRALAWMQARLLRQRSSAELGNNEITVTDLNAPR